MTIGKKLMAGFGALLVCLLGLSYFSLTAVAGLRNDLDEVANKTARKIYLAGAIDNATAWMRAEVRAFILAAVLKNAGDLETARGNFGKKAAQAEQAIKEIRPLLVTGSEKNAADQLESAVSAWKQSFDEMVRLCGAGQTKAADQVRIVKQRPIAAQMVKASDEIISPTQNL